MEQEMNETKSKTLLIVSTVAILVISSAIIAVRLINPPIDRLEVFSLEVFRIEPKSTKVNGWIANNIWLRWFGERTEINIALIQHDAFSNQIYKKTDWTEFASYGYVFNISIPVKDHSVYISFDSIALRLNFIGMLYYRNNGTLYNPDWEPPEDAMW